LAWIDYQQACRGSRDRILASVIPPFAWALRHDDVVNCEDIEIKREDEYHGAMNWRSARECT